MQGVGQSLASPASPEATLHLRGISPRKSSREITRVQPTTVRVPVPVAAPVAVLVPEQEINKKVESRGAPSVLPLLRRTWSAALRTPSVGSATPGAPPSVRQDPEEQQQSQPWTGVRKNRISGHER